MNYDYYQCVLLSLQHHNTICGQKQHLCVISQVYIMVTAQEQLQHIQSAECIGAIQLVPLSHPPLLPAHPLFHWKHPPNVLIKHGPNYIDLYQTISVPWRFSTCSMLPDLWWFSVLVSLVLASSPMPSHSLIWRMEIFCCIIKIFQVNHNFSPFNFIPPEKNSNGFMFFNIPFLLCIFTLSDLCSYAPRFQFLYILNTQRLFDPLPKMYSPHVP